MNLSRLTSLALTAAFCTGAGATPLIQPPTLYDNAAGSYGQTFTAVAPDIGGIQWYIGDPDSSWDGVHGALSGVTDLVLHDATNPDAPFEVARTRVLNGSDSAWGLTTFSFSAPVVVVAGTQYFIWIDTTDTAFGLGLTLQNESTYEGGHQAIMSKQGRIGFAAGLAGSKFPLARHRDTSFQIISSIPEPAVWWMVIPALALVARQKQRQT